MKYDNPFPGMNPYLERPHLWRDFHNALISALANDIGPRLPHKYRADLKQRTEVEYLCDPAESMTRRAPTPSLEDTNAVRVLMPREVKVTWLQVEAAPDREVVTVIEVLSPTNKAPGTGRYRYLRKREHPPLDTRVGIPLLLLFAAVADLGILWALGEVAGFTAIPARELGAAGFGIPITVIYGLLVVRFLRPRPTGYPAP